MSTESEINHLREDSRAFREAFQQTSKELAQVRAQAEHWKLEALRIKEISIKTVSELNSHYKKILNEAIQLVKKHPTGGCKDCDLNALAQKIQELAPPSVA